ncbi:hypothetical protein SHI21_06315 [Bacteriovorax sp. PP10]|uniref:Organic solvent tolerance-like N-terminal domain-containing protein n=1 Tax=Bacteriovorax antarcticus TaxID=3088717 RepID=A0ABU5VRX7_9BACT|nr:hypothetical protein [Bacteriovorax sp. PP10]MEA9355804.1 hypothetical protein [Bacteriovorax sp. PP10]
MKSIISITALLSTLSLFSFNAMASVAYGTPIQVNAGATVNIEKLEIGNEILTASEGSTKDNIIAKQIALEFHAGTVSEITTAFIEYGDNSKLITTLDQAMLTISGRLVHVSDLVPGQDQLVDASGNAVNIKNIFIGRFQGGVADFAPKSEYVTENLFLANGVFLGSFRINLQLDQDNNMEAFKGQVLH